jgi:hypothetical protein
MNEPLATAGSTSEMIWWNCLEHGANKEDFIIIRLPLTSTIFELGERICKKAKVSPDSASELSIYICPNGGIDIDNEDQMQAFSAECTTFKPAQTGQSLAKLNVYPKLKCIHIVYKLVERRWILSFLFGGKG